MEKTYQIKIWKIIQIIFYNLLVAFIPFVIIGEFLLQIPQIFPVTFLAIIFYTSISCFRKEIIIKRNKISYFNFDGEEKVLDIIKNDVRIVESVESHIKSLRIKVKRYLKFTENGKRYLKNISWITSKEGNELKTYIWKYKHLFKRKVGKYENDILEEKNFNIPIEKLAILKEMDIKIKFFVISIINFVIFISFSEKGTEKFIIHLIYAIIVETILIIFYIAYYSNMKEKIQKRLPQNITINNLKIIIDKKEFYKSDVKKITMTGLKIMEKSYFKILDVPKVLIIESSIRKQKFLIVPSGVNAKWKYPEYVLLFKSIRNWCFENGIEFIINGY